MRSTIAAAFTAAAIVLAPPPARAQGFDLEPPGACVALSWEVLTPTVSIALRSRSLLLAQTLVATGEDALVRAYNEIDQIFPGVDSLHREAATLMLLCDVHGLVALYQLTDVEMDFELYQRAADRPSLFQYTLANLMAAIDEVAAGIVGYLK